MSENRTPSPFDDRHLIRKVRSRLRWWRRTNLCKRAIGHRFVPLEKGVTRCRFCKVTVFAPEADSGAFFRHLIGGDE